MTGHSRRTSNFVVYLGSAHRFVDQNRSWSYALDNDQRTSKVHVLAKTFQSPPLCVDPSEGAVSDVEMKQYIGQMVTVRLLDPPHCFDLGPFQWVTTDSPQALLSSTCTVQHKIELSSNYFVS